VNSEQGAGTRGRGAVGPPARFAATFGGGNKYLAWAFSEAAEMARRYDTQCRSWYNRKMQKTNFMVAHQALAHKLARAAYCIMKEDVAFMPEKLFAI